MNTTEYRVTAHRDGRWWTFEIPALTAPSPKGPEHRLTAMGQARHTRDIAETARNVVALWVDADPATINVTVTFELPEEVEIAWHLASERESVGRRALEDAAGLRRDAIRALEAAGVSKADAARILGLSKQRISQLSSTGP